MRDQLKLKSKSTKIKHLVGVKDSPYNTDPLFKAKVNKVYDLYGSRETTAKDGRVTFQCKSQNTSELPLLEQESMNSPGGVKIMNVIEYLLNDDGLWKYIKDA